MKSNCLSVVPLETEFGRKRAIDQSSCNKDYSCLKGFCPSFVTVEGGELRKKQAPTRRDAACRRSCRSRLPARLDEPWNILVTGIGGTGVVTIGALLGMAAHLEEKGVSVLDMTGLAQKGGAVISHIRIADDAEATSTRCASPPAARDLLIGCDIVVSAAADGLSTHRAGAHARRRQCARDDHRRVHAQPRFRLPGERSARRVSSRWPRAMPSSSTRRGSRPALLGDSIATNLFMLGYALQKGLVPLSRAAIERAIELNGVAVEFNKRAFALGPARGARSRLRSSARAGAGGERAQRSRRASTSSSQRRVAFLTEYQDAAYAEALRATSCARPPAEAEQRAGHAAWPMRWRAASSSSWPTRTSTRWRGSTTDTGFRDRVAEEFEGNWRARVPPRAAALRRARPHDRTSEEARFGPGCSAPSGCWPSSAACAARALDIFGRTAERRMERQLIGDYEAVAEEILRGLTPENHATAVALAAVPLEIRGFGHVKDGNLARAKKKEAELLATFRAPPAPQALAAE